MKKDIYRTSRVMYIFEAAFEYFISIMVGGAYLAKLTTALDISDSITGILSAMGTLACSVQLLAIFIWRNGKVKRSVTILHTINQLCFTLLYVIPFTEVSKLTKTVVFIILLIGGHVLNNVVHSPKINWFMSLVDNNERGKFTANKEIISLIGGMVFTFVMGNIIDSYEAAGKTTSAFILCGVTIFVLTALHTLTLIFSKEKSAEGEKQISNTQLLRELVRDTRLIKVVAVSLIWVIANSVTTPFLGTYQIKELGFSMTFISVLSAVYAIARSAFSRPMGKYADKHSFAKMLNICFIVACVGFVVNIFTVPSNGKIFYTVYYVLSAVSMAGINSGGINLIYEYVSVEKRICALALKNTLTGIAGFITTLVSSRLVEYIQANGNKLFGIRVYAQQVISAISALLVVVLIIYLNTVVKKIPAVKENA